MEISMNQIEILKFIEINKKANKDLAGELSQVRHFGTA